MYHHVHVNDIIMWPYRYKSTALYKHGELLWKSAQILPPRINAKITAYSQFFSKIINIHVIHTHTRLFLNGLFSSRSPQVKPLSAEKLLEHLFTDPMFFVLPWKQEYESSEGILYYKPRTLQAKNNSSANAYSHTW